MSDTEEELISPLLLTKLYDETGNAKGGNKGFILFMVDKEGEVVYISKFADTVTEIALTTSAKSVLLAEKENFLEEEEGDDD